MNKNNLTYIHEIWTKANSFYGQTNPIDLIKNYGSPLYVYNENILRQRCRDLKNLIPYPNFRVNYSAKANTNPSLLRIVRSEGLSVDAMSAGEIFLELQAGYQPEEIFFVGNNVSDDEIAYAVKTGVLFSADSLSQLERYGRLNPGGKVAVRINPGIGAGHHEKVITAGDKTKFGINPVFIDEIKSILTRYQLRLVGINQHIGSHFMSANSFLKAVSFILAFAADFPDLEFVDLGGGFGIPYHKERGEKPMNLKSFGKKLQKSLDLEIKKSDRQLTIMIEPGRYVAAECGVLLGQVHAIKESGGKKYIGTDLGFNVLVRPIMYDAYHDLEIYSDTARNTTITETVTVVGNICESGDIIAKDRTLPVIAEGDILGVLDAGAYGMSMSSNYNCRLKPAEVLIDSQGHDHLIRKRDQLEDLVRQFI